MNVVRQFEKRGPLWLPRYEPEPDPRLRRYKRYRRRWRPQAAIAWTNNYGSNGESTGANLSITVPSTTAGNFMICVLEANATITGVGMGSQTFTLDVNAYTGERTVMASLPNIAGGQTTVTVNSDGATIYWAICAEFSGIATTSPLDVAGTADSGSSGTTWSANSISTQNANDLIIGLGGDHTSAATLTAGTGYSLVATYQNSTSAKSGILVYEIVSSTGSYTPNGGGVVSGDSWAGVASSYEGAAAAFQPDEDYWQGPGPGPPDNPVTVFE
jgi:hypothetical protein